MRVTAEISLYPLTDAYIPPILAFIRSLEASTEIEIVVNQMSTQLRGELAIVLGALESAMRESFRSSGQQVLVAKFLSADLPIAEPPTL